MSSHSSRHVTQSDTTGESGRGREDVRGVALAAASRKNKGRKMYEENGGWDKEGKLRGRWRATVEGEGGQKEGKGRW